VPLILWGHTLLRLWLGAPVEVSFALLLLMGIWTVILAVGNALAMFLNGANELGIQVVLASVMGLSVLGLKLLLCSRMGVEGIVLASIVGYLAVSGLPQAFIVPAILRRLSQRKSGGERSVQPAIVPEPGVVPD
jgi:hypothetical protein